MSTALPFSVGILLIVMSALGMMFMASANDLLSLFVTLEFFFHSGSMYRGLREDPPRMKPAQVFILVFAGLWPTESAWSTGNRQAGLSDMASARPRRAIIGFLIFAALGFKSAPSRSIPDSTPITAPTPVTAFSIAPKGTSHRHPAPVVLRCPVHF